MSLDARTAQEQLTPEERRSMLRAFADRMLLKISSMDDPEDMPGAERAVRMASAIERIYSRCDRAEKHAPDPNKLEAERARNAADAIKARVQLTGIQAWGEERRKELGNTWHEAGDLLKPSVVKPGFATPTVTKPDTQKPAKTQTPAAAAAPARVAAPLPGLSKPGVAAPGVTAQAQTKVPAAGDYSHIIEKAMALGLRLPGNDPHSASP